MAQRAQNVQFQRVGGGGGGIVVRPARREGGRRQAGEECRYCHESGHGIRECPRLASRPARAAAAKKRQQQRAEEECRYCREKGHRIRRWNHSTSKNELECPKLIAKEQGKSQENVYSAFSSSQRRMGGGGGSATTSNLGGWVDKAFKNTRPERRISRHGRIPQKAATKISNPFALLDEKEERSPKKAAIPTPRFVTPAAAAGVWGAAATLRKGIDAVLEEEAVAEAIGAVAAAVRKEREAAAAKAAENVGSLVPISKKLPTPAAAKAVATGETSPKSVTFSDEDEVHIMEERGKATASAMRKARRGTWRLDARREQRQQEAAAAAEAAAVRERNMQAHQQGLASAVVPAAAAAADDWEAEWEGSQTTPSVLTSVPGGIDMTIINDGWGDDAGDENGDGW